MEDESRPESRKSVAASGQQRDCEAISPATSVRDVPVAHGRFLFALLYAVAFLIPFFGYFPFQAWLRALDSLPLFVLGLPFGIVQILGIEDVKLGIVVFVCTALAFLLLLWHGIRRKSWFLFFLFVVLQSLAWYGMYMQRNVFRLEEGIS